MSSVPGHGRRPDRLRRAFASRLRGLALLVLLLLAVDVLLVVPAHAGSVATGHHDAACPVCALTGAVTLAAPAPTLSIRPVAVRVVAVVAVVPDRDAPAPSSPRAPPSCPP